MKTGVKIGIIAGSAIIVIALIYWITNKSATPVSALKAIAGNLGTAADEVASQAASVANKGITYIDSLIPNGDIYSNGNLT
jgi:hypothetical protein